MGDKWLTVIIFWEASMESVPFATLLVLRSLLLLITPDPALWSAVNCGLYFQSYILNIPKYILWDIFDPFFFLFNSGIAFCNHILVIFLPKNIRMKIFVHPQILVQWDPFANVDCWHRYVFCMRRRRIYFKKCIYQINCFRNINFQI